MFGGIWSFFVGLKTKLFLAGAAVLAIAGALLFERHKGKTEGLDIAAGKSAAETIKAIQIRNSVIEQVANAKAGAAQAELSKRFNR